MQWILYHQFTDQLFQNTKILAHHTVALAMFAPINLFTGFILDNIGPRHIKILTRKLFISEIKVAGQHPSLEHFRVPEFSLHFVF